MINNNLVNRLAVSINLIPPILTLVGSGNLITDPLKIDKNTPYLDSGVLAFDYNNVRLTVNIISIIDSIETELIINNSYIYGTGVRTDPPLEIFNKYTVLNICSVRGRITKSFLEKRGFNVPEIFGDPALLLPLFYSPTIVPGLSNKIGVIPHLSNYSKYKYIENNTLYCLINPLEHWRDVINKLFSCKYIISSSLHGLICSDAYNKPNIWLDEFPLCEGDLKFRDYFLSQSRDYIKIQGLEEFDETKLYSGGNRIDLEKLRNAFPFS
jgi:pyruvyltransferase